MSDPFVGEVRMLAFNWAPRGWALCNGATLTVQQNQALYTLIGNAYGGQVPTNFKLPDLQGRTPEGAQNYGSGSFGFGAQGGAEAVVLSAATAPQHMHLAYAVTSAANSIVPTSGLPTSISAAPPAGVSYNAYSLNPSPWSPVALANDTVQTVGANAPHNNMQPFAVVNFAICLSGLYPTRP